MEPVDDAGAPVPPGIAGARLWVTVLFSRTVPLIRYEMSDQIALGPRGCPCGRSFARLESVQGRLEDVLELPGTTGRVRVHPNVFHGVLDDASRDGWQVVQHPGGLQVRVAGLGPGRTAGQVGTAVQAALAGAGVTGVPVQVDVVGQLHRTGLGKAPLVVSVGRDRAGGP